MMMNQIMRMFMILEVGEICRDEDERGKESKK